MNTRCLTRRISVALAVLLSSGWALSPTRAASHRLLDTTEAFSQEVLRSQVSPDGQWVVYDALGGSSPSRSLLSAPVAGGEEVELVADFAGIARVTADSTRVVYLEADFYADEFGLFSVPIEGGPVVQLNADLGAGGELSESWSLTADGQRAIFRSKQDATSPFELFSVSVSGGPITKLNGELVAGGNVTGFLLRPGGSTLVYRADQLLDGVTELFTVAVTGGIATRLNTPLARGRSIRRYGISPDDTKAFYIADQDTDDVFELYGVALVGEASLQAGSATKLSAPLVSGGDVREAAFSPDASRVVYTADGDVDDTTELYSVPSVGGPVVKVNGPLVQDGSVLSFPGNWQVDPSSQRVIYRADQDTNATFELYSAALTGGDVHKLALPMAGEGAVEGGFTISDGRVVFRSDAETENIFELYSAPLGGGLALKLNPPLMFDRVSVNSVENNFLVSSGEVFYNAPIGSFHSGLHRVPITGGDSIQLSLPASFVSDFFLSSDGSDLFYTAPLVPGLVDLYRRPATIPGVTVQLNRPSSFESGRVGQIDVSESAGRVIYAASRDVLRTDLFSLPLGGGDPAQLNTPSGVSGSVEAFYLSPAGQRVIYVADQDIAEKPELFSVSVEGGDLVKLNIPVADGGGAISRLPYPFSPDGNTVVYRTFKGIQTECDEIQFVDFELFSVAADGGTPVALHPPLGPCVQAFDFVISPTGDRVIYSTQDWKVFSSKLMSVPLDGGASVQLGPEFALDFFQDQLEMTADGSMLVYLAKPADAALWELFSVPVTGGDPIKLVDPPPAHGSIRRDWDLSPDGLRVVYASAAEPGRVVLSSVPITGGPSIELSGPMVEGANVEQFAISSSFGRVVFMADGNVDGIMELFSASLVGGVVTQLNAPLDANQRVAEFAISEDSNHVVYRVRGLDGFSALFRASLVGGPVTRLSHDLVAGEFIDSFKIDQQSRHVAYNVSNGELGFGVHYRVPIAGGGAVRFSPTSVAAEGDFDAESPEIWLSPDSSRLMYGASQPGTFSTDLWLSEESDLFLDGFETGDTNRWSTVVGGVQR